MGSLQDARIMRNSSWAFLCEKRLSSQVARSINVGFALGRAEFQILDIFFPKLALAPP